MGKTFTEDQMRVMFGVSPPGGIRMSEISDDIILVSRVDIPTIYNDKDSGEYVTFDGKYWNGSADLTVTENKALSESQKNGNRVLYFVKEHNKLAFHGRVECVGWETKNDPRCGNMVTFKMKRVNDEIAQPTSLRYATVVSIVEDEDGGYVATAPSLPGCISQGETIAQARENLEEAISLYLECLLESGEAFPPGLASALNVAAVDILDESVSAKISTVP